MSLKKFKRGDIWYLRGAVRGQRVNETTGTSHEDAAEAIRIKREAELLDTSIYGKKAVVTFEQAALAYLEAGGSGQFLGSYNPVTSRWNGMTGQFFGRKLHTITQADLDSFARRSRPKAKGQSRRRSVYTPFIAVWNHAHKMGWCEKKGWVLPKPDEAKKRRYATIPEVIALEAAAVDGPNKRLAHLKPLIPFLVYTGMRPSEAFALEWEQVDLANRWCWLLTSKTDIPRGVPLHPRAIAALEATPENKRKGRVFRTHKGLPFAERDGDSGQIKNSFKTLCKDAGVVGLTPYCLRHTFSTWAKAMGMDEQDRKLIMGHASNEMNHRYTHVPQEALIETVALLPSDTSAKSVHGMLRGFVKALTCKG